MANILIADDSSTMRKLILYALKPTGHIGIEASDGIEALEKMALTDIDLAIIDLNMPMMDGLELVRSIRENPLYDDLPIIMLTTEADNDTKKRGYEAGVNTYLTKPTPHHLLIYKIESLINKAC